MADDEDDEEQESSGRLSAARPHVPIAIVSAAAIVLAWWNPFGLGPVAWFVWPIAVTALAMGSIFVFQVGIRSKKVGLGETEILTIGPKQELETLPAEYSEDGTLLCGPMLELRVGGKSWAIATEGRDFAYFPDVENVIESGKLYMKVHADFGGTWYTWRECPHQIRKRLVKVIDWGYGTPGEPGYRPMKVEVVKKGYVIGKSRVYIAWKATPRNTPKEEGGADVHHYIQSQSDRILELESMVYGNRFMQKSPEPPKPPPQPGQTLVGP